tara:strand:- start:228 stop:875 length:648 start_codon:yes stop_codon:yes gene_type:complete
VKEKILMVMAHPDDEILFGWPIFFNPNYEKKLIICSSDFNNPDRKWCKYRKHSLFKVCNAENVPVYCLDYNSSFYKTPTRRPKNLPRNDYGDSQAPFRKMCDHIAKAVRNVEDDFDYIFTHNPYGEYGHMDHKLLFELILKTTKKDILITDICINSNWAAKKDFTKKINRLYYSNKIDTCSIDIDKYKKYEDIYKQDNVWTWSRPIPEKCSLYKI